MGCNGVIKSYIVWACAASDGHLDPLARLRGCEGVVWRRCWAARTCAASARHHALAASMLHVQLPKLQCRPAGGPQALDLRSHERPRGQKSPQGGSKVWAPEHACRWVMARRPAWQLTALAWSLTQPGPPLHEHLTPGAVLISPCCQLGSGCPHALLILCRQAAAARRQQLQRWQPGLQALRHCLPLPCQAA